MYHVGRPFEVRTDWRRARMYDTQTTSYLLDDGLLLVEALLGTGLGDAAGGAAELPRHLLTLGLGGKLLDGLPLGDTDLSGPLGTLLLGGVALGDVLTLLLLDGLALDDVILHIVLVVPGLTLGLVNGLTLLGTLTLADKRGVTEPENYKPL